MFSRDIQARNGSWYRAGERRCAWCKCSEDMLEEKRSDLQLRSTVRKDDGLDIQCEWCGTVKSLREDAKVNG